MRQLNLTQCHVFLVSDKLILKKETNQTYPSVWWKETLDRTFVKPTFTGGEESHNHYPISYCKYLLHKGQSTWRWCSFTHLRSVSRPFTASVTAKRHFDLAGCLVYIGPLECSQDADAQCNKTLNNLSKRKNRVQNPIFRVHKILEKFDVWIHRWVQSSGIIVQSPRVHL